MSTAGWGPNSRRVAVLFDRWTEATYAEREATHTATVQLGGFEALGLTRVAQELPPERMGGWLQVGYDALAHALIHRPRRTAGLWLAARAVALVDLVGLLPSLQPVDYYRACQPWIAAFGPDDVLDGPLRDLIDTLIPEHRDGNVWHVSALQTAYRPR